MEKRLRSFTVIPSELYVPRRADRQVEAILDDLGRPGYVLVARQMGKTNLILHARNSLACDGDLFAYLDVSNPIPELRDFLRNIIDVCLESPRLATTVAAEKISELRSGRLRLPHKEHEAELSIIAKNISGRLVICLDEIDALIGSGYSDQVFSFIRSVYFSGRVNFDEFSRVTYLLSGVAEPSDIIKNKDVSPFNIGAKIYLEDFERAEVDRFLQQAELVLAPEVVDCVYSWTSGHPRMTWDVFSAIEDACLSGIDPTLDLVNFIVKRHYFGEMDFPPVDQIKRMALESRDMRDALMSLHYERGTSIPRAMRTRLYLAGISRMDPEGDVMSFKNRIFEDALSEEFIHSAGPDNFMEIVADAQRLLVAADCRRMLYLLDTIDGAHLNEERSWTIRLLRAQANVLLGHYDRTIDYLKNKAAPTSEENIQRAFVIGTAYLRAGDFLEAERELLLCVDLDDKLSQFEYWPEASVDLAQAIMKLGSRPRSFVEALCNSILSRHDAVVNGRSLFKSGATVLVQAHVAKAHLERAANEVEKSNRSLLLAEEYAKGSVKIRVLLQLLDQDRAGVGRRLYLERAIASFKDVKKLSAVAVDSPEIADPDLIAQLLDALDKNGLVEGIKSIVDHLVRVCSDDDFAEMFPALLGLTRAGGNQRLAGRLIESILGDADSFNGNKDFAGYLISIDSSKAVTYGDRFVNAFQDEPEGGVGSHNVFALLTVYLESSRSSELQGGASASGLIRAPLSDEDQLDASQLATLRIVREFVHCLDQIQDGAVDSGAVRALVTRMHRIDRPSLSFFPADTFDRLTAELSGRLSQMGAPLNRKEGRKIGRNEMVVVRYKDRLVSGKYKKFQGDIAMGICDLVSVGSGE